MGSGCISDFVVIVHGQYPAKRITESGMNGYEQVTKQIANIRLTGIKSWKLKKSENYKINIEIMKLIKIKQ